MLLNKKIINTLIVEDFPATAEAYGNIITANTGFNIKVKIAHNCDEAIEQLQSCTKNLVLLDLQLPASKDNKFISGEDIGLWLRKKYSKTKIIIITSISDSERIRGIIKHINPEGFFIKSDLDSTTLTTAVQDVLNGKTHYSKTIKDFTDNNNNNNNNTVNGHIIDEIDRKILYHLSMGEKTKDLPKLLHISIRAIEDRKVKLKDMFEISKNSDTNLIKEAKLRHLI